MSTQNSDRMASLPTIMYPIQISTLTTDALDCAVCQMRLGVINDDGKTEQPVKTICGHIFGESCLTSWLREHASCPVCREELLPLPPSDQNIQQSLIPAALDRAMQENPNLSSIFLAGANRFFAREAAQTMAGQLSLLSSLDVHALWASYGANVAEVTEQFPTILETLRARFSLPDARATSQARAQPQLRGLPTLENFALELQNSYGIVLTEDDFIDWPTL